MKYDPKYKNFPIYENDDGEEIFGPRYARAIVIREVQGIEGGQSTLKISYGDLMFYFPEAFKEARFYLRKWIEEIESKRASLRRELCETLPRLIKKKESKPRKKAKAKSFKSLRKPPGRVPAVIEEERAC